MLEKTLGSPLDSKEINQSILKEIYPEYSLEGLVLKLQHYGPWCEELTHWKRPWCWEKIEGRRRRGWQRTKRLDGIINSTDMILSQLRETAKHRDASCAAVHEVAKSWTRLSNWTSTTTTSWGCKRNYWIYWLSIPFSHSWSYFLPRVPLPMLNFPHSAIPTRIKAMQLETTSLTTGPFQQLRLWDKIKK